MKNHFFGLGKALTKTEQRKINGGVSIDPPNTHYTVGCSNGPDGHVNSVAEANELIKECWDRGGIATIRSND